MKLIFVAGPFAADTPWGVEQNIRRAEEVALLLWSNEFAVICPHANSRFFYGAIGDDNIFIEGYRDILKKCDGVMLVSGHEHSAGTLAEKQLAKSLDIPVFDSIVALVAHFGMLNNEKS